MKTWVKESLENIVYIVKKAASLFLLFAFRTVFAFPDASNTCQKRQFALIFAGVAMTKIEVTQMFIDSTKFM